MLLNKSDLTKYARISDNLKATEIDPFIQDAQIFDVIPVLPDDMFEDIEAALPVPQIGWDKNKSYVADDIVFHLDKFWKSAGSNTDSEPITGNTDWDLHELLNFWLNYVKPFYAYNTLSRFLVEHGRNITQFGITQQTGDTFQNLSDKGRAEMKAQMDSKANHYGQLIRKELASKSYTFDGVTYEYSCDDVKPRPKFKLFQAGNPKNNDTWPSQS